jgi:hypothetical protein
VSMATAEAGSAGLAQDVLVAREVLDEMHQLEPAIAEDVARAIQSIDAVRGEPIPLTVPGVPPGSEHFAIVPASEDAPVVIYRTMTENEPGRYRVTSLMDRAAYDAYRKAVKSGLLDDETLKALLVVGGILVAAYLLTRGKGGTPS